MALIKTGAAIAEIRGKLGGAVYSRNTYGAYARNKVTPANPQTADQQEVRNSLATLAQAWRGLTDPLRATWNQGAQNFSRTNIFGDKVNLTGFNLFIQINRNLAEAGVAMLTSCPAPAAVTGLTNLASLLCNTTPVFTVTFAPTPVPANYALFVSATPPMSPGVSYAKEQFRLLKIIAAAVATGASIQTEYTAKFGAQTLGNKILVRAKLVNIVTGLSSTHRQYSVTVAAP